MCVCKHDGQCLVQDAVLTACLPVCVCVLTAQKHGLYVAFLESFVKTVSDRLKVEDVRKLSTMLNTLANEKQRAEKDQQKKKKSSKAKAQVRVAAGDEDGDEEAYAGGGSRGFYEHDYDDLYGAC